MDAGSAEVTVVPANEASWDDLQAVLGRAFPSQCQCQRLKMRGREVSHPTLRRVVMRLDF